MKRSGVQRRVFIVILLAATYLAHADWQRTGGFKVGTRSIGCMAVSGGNVFAGSPDSGVFLSTNSGNSWTPANSGLTNKSVRSFAVSGTNLFAVTGNDISLSTNNGSSWTAVNTGSPPVNSLAVDGTNLFVVTGDSAAVYISTNNGATWTRAPTGLPNGLNYLAVSGTNLFGGSDGGVSRSTNSGVSWTTPANTGWPGKNGIRTNSLAVIGTNLFAGSDSGVFLSTDNGENWTSTNSPARFVKFLDASGANLFAGTSNNGGFLSTDNGANWIPANTNTGLTNKPLRSFAASGTNLFVGSDSGVFLSTNNGASWAPADTGLTFIIGVNVASLAAMETNLFAGSDSGVYLSADNGANWTLANKTFKNISSFVVSGTNLFGLNGYSVFLSIDNGTNWTSVNTKSGKQIASFAVIGGKFFAGIRSSTIVFTGATDSCILSSTDNGVNWAQAHTRNGDNSVFTGINSFTVSGGNLLAGTFGLGVFLSTDNGANWTTTNGLGMVYNFAKSGNTVFASTGAGVALSTDNGANWALTANAGLTGSVNTSFAVSGVYIFAANDSGVFLTSNNGASWIKVTTGMPTATRVNSIAISGMNLYAGASGNGAGIWRRPLSEVMQPPTDAPVLTSPSNGATNLPLNPSLNWNAVAGASTYRVQVSENSDCSSPFFDDTILSSSILLSPGKTYYWRMNAKNAVGTGSWSAIWSFSTVPAAPGAVTLVSPTDNAVNIPINTTVMWNGLPGSSKYYWQISTDPQFNTFVKKDSSVTDTIGSCGTLFNDMTYFWRVRASNAGGAGIWSSVRKFTTIVAIPSMTVLKTPLAGDTIRIDSVELTWQKGTLKIDHFWVQCSSDSSFATFAQDSMVMDTVKVIRALQNNSGLWWRVKAHNAAGWGDWSVKAVFKVIIPSTCAGHTNLPKIFNFAVSDRNGYITYALPQAEHVSLRLYNSIGRLQLELIDKLQNAGYYSLSMQRRACAAGAYLVIFKAGSYYQKKTIFLMR
jgi:hypothetical protein